MGKCSHRITISMAAMGFSGLSQYFPVLAFESATSFTFCLDPTGACCHRQVPACTEHSKVLILCIGLYADPQSNAAESKDCVHLKKQAEVRKSEERMAACGMNHN